MLGQIHDVVMSPDGKYVLCATELGRIDFFELAAIRASTISPEVGACSRDRSCAQTFLAKAELKDKAKDSSKRTREPIHPVFSIEVTSEGLLSWRLYLPCSTSRLTVDTATL